jgi:hypothetical protein
VGILTPLKRRILVREIRNLFSRFGDPHVTFGQGDPTGSTGGSVTPPAPFAVTSKGTIVGLYDPGGSTTAELLANVTVGSGSMLVVVAGQIVPVLQISMGAMWGGENLSTLSYAASDGDTFAASIFELYVPVGGTQDIVVTNVDGANQIVFTVLEVTGGGMKSSDKFDANFGVGTTPSSDSGVNPPTTVANEVLIGGVVTRGPSTDTAGTWSNSFTGVQRVGGSGDADDVTVSDAFRIVSSTGSYVAAKTAITSRSWIALIGTIKGEL